MIEASANDTAEFYDMNGNIITEVPASRVVNVSAWLDSGEVYAPVISAVSPTASDDKSGGNNVGSSSGGCEAFALLPVILSAMMIHLFRRKEH